MANIDNYTKHRKEIYLKHKKETIQRCKEAYADAIKMKAPTDVMLTMFILHLDWQSIYCERFAAYYNLKQDEINRLEAKANYHAYKSFRKILAQKHRKYVSYLESIGVKPVAGVDPDLFFKKINFFLPFANSNKINDLNKELISSSEKYPTLKWQKDIKDLKKMYTTLLKIKAIEANTLWDDFKTVFSGELLLIPIRIKWIFLITDLGYLFYLLRQFECFPVTCNISATIKNGGCFVVSDDGKHIESLTQVINNVIKSPSKISTNGHIIYEAIKHLE